MKTLHITLPSSLLVILVFASSLSAQNTTPQKYWEGVTLGKANNHIYHLSGLALDSGNNAGFAFYNPALLAKTDKASLQVASLLPGLSNFLSGVHQIALAGAYRLNDKHVLGLSANYLQANFADIQNFSALSTQLSYAYSYSNKLQLAASVGWYSRVYGVYGNWQYIAYQESKVAAPHFNLGALYKTNWLKSLKLIETLAISLINLGGSSTSDNESDDILYARPEGFFYPATLELAYQLEKAHALSKSGLTGSVFLGLSLSKTLVQLPGISDTSGNFIYGADNRVSLPASMLNSFTKNYNQGDFFRLINPTVDIGYVIRQGNDLSLLLRLNYLHARSYWTGPASTSYKPRLYVTNDFTFSTQVQFRQFALQYAYSISSIGNLGMIYGPRHSAGIRFKF